MAHIMVDLETLGTSANAPIIAIGAVAFTDTGLIDGAEFYHGVNLEASVKQGAVIDPSTVLWWLQQEDSAQLAAVKAAQTGTMPHEIVPMFTSFMNLYGETQGVWGNGAAFDNVLMAALYKNNGGSWPFWLDRCYRTMKNYAPDVKLQRVGVHHNALDDAKSQALHLIEINKKLGFNL